VTAQGAPGALGALGALGTGADSAAALAVGAGSNGAAGTTATLDGAPSASGAGADEGELLGEASDEARLGRRALRGAIACGAWRGASGAGSFVFALALVLGGAAASGGFVGAGGATHAGCALAWFACAGDRTSRWLGERNSSSVNTAASAAEPRAAPSTTRRELL